MYIWSDARQGIAFHTYPRSESGPASRKTICFRFDVGRRGARALDAINTGQAAVVWHSTVGMASL